MATAMPLLDIRNLRVEFPSRRGSLVAVDDVSLAVEPGDILGVVGESGAGKSTVGNAVIGLLEPPGEMTAGEVHLAGRRIDNLDDAEKRRLRGKRIGMIFQDPLTSLNPLQTVEQQLVETIDLHLGTGEAAAKRRSVDLLRQVGIPEPELRVKQHPHQFSGGMRQRVVIALALAAEPDVIIADEPTTALDVSIQAQILDLMRALCKEGNVGMMIITHDMGVIADVTDRVAVMYRGRLVEHGATEQVLGRPEHPYTRSLISAVPRPDVKLVRFPLVTYIEDAGETMRHIDVKHHWLGQARDFEGADGTAGGPLVSLESLHMRFTTPTLIPPEEPDLPGCGARRVAGHSRGRSVRAGRRVGLGQIDGRPDDLRPPRPGRGGDPIRRHRPSPPCGGKPTSTRSGARCR